MPCRRATSDTDVLHLHLWSISPRQLPASTEDPTRPQAAEAWGHQGGATAQDASADSRAREMAEAGRGWPLRLLRGSDKQSGALGVPALCDRSLATNASAAQSERWVHMETHDEVGRRLASPAAHPSSLARRSL